MEIPFIFGNASAGFQMRELRPIEKRKKKKEKKNKQGRVVIAETLTWGTDQMTNQNTSKQNKFGPNNNTSK